MGTYPVSVGDTATAAANTAVVATYAAQPGARHTIKQIVADYSGNPTGGLVTIEDGAGNVVRSFPVTTASRTIDFPDSGIAGTINRALIVTLAAGGAGITGRLNIIHGMA